MATISERLQYVLSFDTRQAISALNQVGKAGEDALDDNRSRLDKAAGGMVKYGAAAMATAGVAGMAMYKLAMSASQVEESTNAVNVTFEDQADAIFEIGKTSAQSMGLSTAAFNQAAVGFSSFAQRVAGDGGDVAKTTTDMMVRASDFASVLNIDVGRAMNVFRSAMAGETESIKQFGIDMSAASVEAYAVANGIDETGKKMDATQTAMARYGLLMQSTEQMAGDFVNTSDSLANSQRILAADIENLKANIGAGLVPMFGTLISVASKVAGVFAGMSTENQKMIGSFAGGGVALLGLAGAASFTLGSILKLKKTMEAFPRTAAAMSVGMGVASLALVAYSINARQAAQDAAELTEAIDEVSRASDDQAIAAYYQVLAQGIATGKGARETVDAFARANLEGAERVLRLAEAQGIENDAIDKLNAAVWRENDARKNANRTTEEAARVAAEAAHAADGQLNVMSDVEIAAGRMGQVQEESAEEAAQAWEDWADELTSSAEAAQDNYDTMIDAAEDWAASLRGAVDAGSASFINFDAKQDESVAQYTARLQAEIDATKFWEASLAEMIGQNTRYSETEKETLLRTFSDMGAAGGDMVAELSTLPADVQAQTFDTILAGASETTDGMLGEFDPVAKELGQRMGDAKRELVEQMTQIENTARTRAKAIGTPIPPGIANGMIEGLPGLLAVGRRVMQDLVTSMQAEIISRSPSRLFAEKIGQPIAQGVAEGIIEDSDKITDALEDALEDAKDAAVDAAEDLVDAVQDELDGLWDGIKGPRDIADLEEGVSDSERRVEKAKKSLARANEAVAEAQRKLNELRTVKAATPEELAEAEERLSDAAWRVEESLRAQAKAQEKVDSLRAKGVTGTVLADAEWALASAARQVTKDQAAQAKAEAELAALRAGKTGSAEEIADAEERLADARENVIDTTESLDDAVESLKDAKLDLVEATIENIDGSKEEAEAWVALAKQAGLTSVEIRALAAAYRELNAARKDQEVAQGEVAAEADRKSVLLNDWGYAVRQGWVTKAHLDHLATLKDPLAQFGYMTTILNNIQRYFGTEPKKYHSGGVIPGPAGANVPIMAQAGERIVTPAQSTPDPKMQAREMAREFAKVLKQEMRTM